MPFDVSRIKVTARAREITLKLRAAFAAPISEEERIGVFTRLFARRRRR